MDKNEIEKKKMSKKEYNKAKQDANDLICDMMIARIGKVRKTDYDNER